MQQGGDFLKITPNMKLWEAARLNDIEGISRALEHGANINARKNGVRLGGTALNIAVAMFNVKAVKHLISFGADVEISGTHNTPPLITAIVSGAGGQSAWASPPPVKEREEIVALLLAAGASVQIPDKSMWGDKITWLSPLGREMLSGSDKPAIMKMLLEAGADPFCQELFNGRLTSINPILHQAAEYDEIEKLKIALQYMSVDTLNNNKETAFYVSVNKSSDNSYMPPEHIECLNLLVEAGADVNFRTHKGYAAVDWASDNPDLMLWLLNKGANIEEAKKARGLTPKVRKVINNFVANKEAYTSASRPELITGFDIER